MCLRNFHWIAISDTCNNVFLRGGIIPLLVQCYGYLKGVFYERSRVIDVWRPYEHFVLKKTWAENHLISHVWFYTASLNKCGRFHETCRIWRHATVTAVRSTRYCCGTFQCSEGMGITAYNVTNFASKIHGSCNATTQIPHVKLHSSMLYCE